MADRITVLRPNPVKSVSKIVSKTAAGKYKVSSPTMPSHFSAETRSVNDIKSLADLMMELYDNTDSFIIRGTMVHGTDPDKHRRRMHGQGRDGSYEPQNLHTVVLDFDKISLSVLGKEKCDESPESYIKAIIQFLPGIFRRATVFYRYSGSQGYKGEDNISCHLHYWLNEAVSELDLKAYFGVHNDMLRTVYGMDFNFVDLALFNPIQPIFTSKPILGENVIDLFPDRCGLIEGQKEEVEWNKDWIGYESTERQTSKSYFRFLDRVGDDGDGFHEPIMQAIAAFIRYYGEPSLKLRTEIKDLIRESIDSAHIDPHRDDDSIRRYRSDYFLDQLIDGAVRKGFGASGPSEKVKTELLERYVYLQATDEFYDVNTGITLTQKVFDNTHMSVNKGKRLSPLLLCSPDFKIVHTTQQLPGLDPGIISVGGLQILNTWQGRPISPSNGDASKFIDHIRYLLDDDDDAFDHFIKFLAHIVQKPGVKIRHLPILGSSHQGTGKSYLKYVMKRLIGADNVRDVTNDEIKSQYTNWAKNIEVAFVEELMIYGRKEIANHLKPIVTEDNIVIHEKFKPTYTIQNHFNVIAFTNHRNATTLDATDRRYWVWYSDQPPKNGDYYIDLFKWTKEHISDIYGYLLSVDLSGFSADLAPPKTVHREEMKELSKSPLEAFIEERMQERTWPFQHDIIRVQHVLDVLPNKFGAIQSFKFATDMKKYGAIRIVKKLKEQGKARQITFWALDDAEKYEKMTARELLELYTKPGGPDDVEGVDY